MTDRPVDAPAANHPLLLAARYNDAETEETSLAAVVERHGLDLHEVEYVAEQRAARVVLLQSGREAEARSTECIEVELSDQERALLDALTPLYMDAIFLGWRGRMLEDGHSDERA